MSERKTWEQFMQESKTERTLYNDIEQRKNAYTDNDVNDQINMLKKAFEEIRKKVEKLKQEIEKIRKQLEQDKKKSKEEIEKEVQEIEAEELNELKINFQMQMNGIFAEIRDPSLNDFYRKKTLEYIKENNISIDSYVKSVLESKKDIIVMAQRADYHENTYTSNLPQNIEVFVCELISDLVKYDYSISQKFNNIREKIKNNTLEPADTPLVIEYVNKLLQEALVGRQDLASKTVKKDVNSMYKVLVENMDQFFEKDDFDQEPEDEKKPEPDNKTVSSEDIFKQFQETHMQRHTSYSVNGSFSNIKRKPIVRLKKCIRNPFLGDDKENNLMIFIYGLLKFYEDQDLLQTFYELLIQSKQNNQARDLIKKYIVRDLNYPDTAMHIRALLNKRLCKLISLYEDSGEINKYNEKNNERLRKISASQLCISTEDLLEILYSLENSKQVSIESLNGMSALYLNRLTKILPMFTRRKFIFDKKGVIDKLYENPNLSFEDFKFSEEEVRLYMAQYDALQAIIDRDYLKKLTMKEFEKLEYDDKTSQKAKEMLKDVIRPYIRPYLQQYGGDFITDIDNVIVSCELSKLIYGLKNYSIKSLIYTALTEKESGIINWGYVPDDSNGDAKKALLGFDIKFLNMPIFVHVDKDDIEKTIKDITGDVLIPVYEGEMDFILHGAKRMTTQIAYPISKDQRKILIKQNPHRTILQHLRWLQRPNERPGFLAEPGSKMYNFQTGKIERRKKQTKKPDNPDDPNL